jgi:hypothetical protein
LKDTRLLMKVGTGSQKTTRSYELKFAYVHAFSRLGGHRSFRPYHGYHFHWFSLERPNN